MCNNNVLQLDMSHLPSSGTKTFHRQSVLLCVYRQHSARSLSAREALTERGTCSTEKAVLVYGGGGEGDALLQYSDLVMVGEGGGG
jgi:hypothetical protein